MFVNAYDFEVENLNGEMIPVSLRLGVGSQMKLKKRFNESTTSTLFGAVDDIEKFVAVMDEALKWKGNTNKIQSGEELIDLMAANDMLGMVNKQRVITALGRASGLFSEKEKQKIDKRTENAIDGVFDEDEEDNSKNA